MLRTLDVRSGGSTASISLQQSQLKYVPGSQSIIRVTRQHRNTHSDAEHWMTNDKNLDSYAASDYSVESLIQVRRFCRSSRVFSLTVKLVATASRRLRHFVGCGKTRDHAELPPSSGSAALRALILPAGQPSRCLRRSRSSPPSGHAGERCWWGRAPVRLCRGLELLVRQAVHSLSDEPPFSHDNTASLPNCRERAAIGTRQTA